jgi:hypothetical protein
MNTEQLVPLDERNEIHVIPFESWQPHVLSASCWCQPKRSRCNSRTYIHQVFDDGEDVHLVRVH